MRNPDPETTEKAEQIWHILTMEMKALRRYKKLNESEKNVMRYRIEELRKRQSRLLERQERDQQRIAELELQLNQ